VAHFQAARLEQGADGRRQFQQAQQVGHRRARAADRFGGLAVGQGEFADQPLQRLRFFQRVEVLALDILDQRHGDDGAVVQFAHHHRHLGQAGQLGGAPAAFAGDDLVTAAAVGAYHDRLDHALGADRVGQLVQLGRVHRHARLVLARLQLANRDVAQGFTGLGFGGRGFGALGAEQGFQAAAEAALLRGGHQWVSMRGGAGRLRSCWRRMSSPARPR